MWYCIFGILHRVVGNMGNGYVPVAFLQRCNRMIVARTAEAGC